MRNIYMKHFAGLTDINAIKARYKDLAKTYHPDLGGCVETMKEINRQYDEVLTGVYQKEGKSITEIEDLLAASQALREKLFEITAMPNLIVELCGEWIWVTGDTRPSKELLKSAGFFWASKKLAWYWRSESEKGKRRGNYSMDKIRELHGSSSLSGMNYKVAIG